MGALAAPGLQDAVAPAPRLRTCVLLRVHDRMHDLEICVDVIRKHWTRGEYVLLVASNGGTRGLTVPPSVRSAADRVLEVEGDAGHFGGSAQLLREGIRAVPDDCRWTILLEADTWIFGDDILQRYIRRLEAEQKVWASALWVERFYTLALDVAVVNTAFAKSRPHLFDFVEPPGPEAWVHNQLRAAGQRPLYIREHMPVHVPALLRRFYSGHGGRFRTFTAARMVTHHLEDLSGALQEKLRIANEVLGVREFNVPGPAHLHRRRIVRRLTEGLRSWVPRSSWIRPRRWRMTA